MAEVNHSIVELRAGKTGTDKIGEIHENITGTGYDTIIIDLTKYKYIHPCFATLIASSVYLGTINKKTVRIRYNPQNEKCNVFLKKSGIEDHYRKNSVPEYNSKNISVPFKKYNELEETFPTINAILDTAPVDYTVELRNILFSKISEIFANAFTHGRGDLGVFSCGFFNDNRIFTFSVYDAGIGICKNVNTYLAKTLLSNSELSNSKSLEWAFEKGNSTLNGSLDYTRGAGLHLLEDFVKANGGRIDLISNGGYCRIKSNERKFYDLSHPIIGTAFSMSINTDKGNKYGIS